MKFTKMHGAGNDYIYVNAFKEKVTDPGELSQVISNRRTGVGSDGLILIAPSKRADFRMIMFNADGSQSEMCGNGVRCIGKYVYEHGLTRKKSLTLETGAGTIALDLNVKGGHVETVTVDMGILRPIPPAFHVRADGKQTRLRTSMEVEGLSFEGTVISMGNPHFVIEVEDPDLFVIEKFGPIIERHKDFPSRVNVEFVRVLPGDRIRQRTWERGSGETFACGSGACAVAAALVDLGRVGRISTVDLLGGKLTIEVTPQDRIFMTGPAVEVFSGEWPQSEPNGKAPRSLKKAKAKA